MILHLRYVFNVVVLCNLSVVLGHKHALSVTGVVHSTKFSLFAFRVRIWSVRVENFSIEAIGATVCEVNYGNL